MRCAVGRARTAALVLLAVVALGGCPPPAERIPWGYARRPWTLGYQYDDDLRLPTIAPSGGPLFYRPLRPHGAVASPLGTHIAMATDAGDLWTCSVLFGGIQRFARVADGHVEAQFWSHVSPWSSDGRALVYVWQGNLMYRRLGGQPRQLTTTGDIFTAAISPDGQQVAYGRRDANEHDGGLWVVPVAGGEPKQLVPPTGDIFAACCPHWSPDGKWIAFMQAFEGGALGIVAADGDDVRQGIEPAWEPIRWLPDSKTVLFAQVVYGEAGDGVRSYNVDTKKTGPIAGPGRQVTYALSPDGAKALVASWKMSSDSKVTDGKLQVVNLATLAPEGETLKLPGSVGRCLWAPDGRQMAVLVEDAQGKGMLWYGPNGLRDMKPLSPASDVIGWVRLRQPPWWRFGR